MDKKTAIMMSMGFEIVGVVFFAIFAGRALDSKYDLGGLATAGFIGLGFVGWLIHVVIIARQMQRESPSDKDSTPQ